MGGADWLPLLVKLIILLNSLSGTRRLLCEFLNLGGNGRALLIRVVGTRALGQRGLLLRVVSISVTDGYPIVLNYL